MTYILIILHYIITQKVTWNITSITYCEEVCRIMAAKLTGLTQKMVLLWYFVAESYTTCHS